MKFYTVLSYTGMIAMPVAPAMLYAHDVHMTMSAANYAPWAAVLVGGIAVVGIESTGALTFSNALKSYQRRSWGYFGLSVLFGLIYAIIMLVGVYTMAMDTGVMSLLVLLTIAAYVGGGVYWSMTDAETADVQKEATALDEIAAEREYELDVDNAARLMLNARIRAKKAGVLELSQNETTETPLGTPDETAVAVPEIDYLTATIPEIRAHAKVSRATAYRYKKEARENA